MKKAKLLIDDISLDLPIIEGTEKEKAIDITSLRKETGYITLDPGFGNTGSCLSKITFIDGESGILRYRGFPIEDLVQNTTFTDLSYFFKIPCLLSFLGSCHSNVNSALLLVINFFI